MLKFLTRTNPEEVGSSSSQNRRRVDVEEVNLAELPVDPGLRKPIQKYHPNNQEAVRRAYLQKGPCQPRGRTFPQTKIGAKLRRFNKVWFDEYKDWIEYSIKEDAVFCLYCYVFKPSNPDQSGGDTFVTIGWKNWKSKEALRVHVGSVNSSHNNARRRCEHLMAEKQHIARSFEKGLDHIRNDYRIRLTTTVKAIRYLLVHGLAFRGNDESEDSLNRENFIGLIEFSGSINEEIKKVILENAPENVKLTSPQIQKDIVNAAVTETIKAIMKEIGTSFFAIMVDESRDISVSEQMAVVVRFVNDKGSVVERFLGVVHVNETSAGTLKKGLEELLVKNGLSLARLRGQGYDGASNMQGQFNGLKALILEENPSAYFVHCFAHQLQLALVAVTKNHTRLSVFFFTVSNLANVIGASCKQLAIFREIQAEKTAEQLNAGEIESGQGLNQERGMSRPGDTCWSSHYKALINLILIYSSVVETLEILEESSDSGTKAEAELLLEKVHSFEFVLCLHMMKNILGVKNDLCQALQRKDQDIVNAMSLVKTSKARLQVMRNEGWDALLLEVKPFCEKHGIDFPDMNASYQVQSWKRRKAEKITNLHHYRVEFFLTVIDMQSTELNNRFTEGNTELLVCMACLSPKDSFAAYGKLKLIHFAQMYPNDFSPADLMELDSQLETFIFDVRSRVEFKDLKGIGDLAHKMVETRLHIVFPLVYTLVGLALTLPIATASVERAFSAMSIVKSRLRNRMGDEWLSDALVTYIEKDVFATIENEAIMERFQSMRNRRVSLT